MIFTAPGRDQSTAYVQDNMDKAEFILEQKRFQKFVEASSEKVAIKEHILSDSITSIAIMVGSFLPIWDSVVTRDRSFSQLNQELSAIHNE